MNVLRRGASWNFLVLGFFIFSLSVAKATEPPKVHVGTRVRVMATEPFGDSVRTRQVTGPLLSINESTLSVENALSGTVFEFPLQNVSRLEISQGGSQRGKKARKGFTYGAVAGLFVGLVLGPEDDGAGPVFWGGLGALTFGALGGITGYIEGPGEQWQAIPMAKIDLGFDAENPPRNGLSFCFRF